MRKKVFRSISLLLAVVLMVTSVNAGVFADDKYIEVGEAYGERSAEDKYVDIIEQDYDSSEENNTEENDDLMLGAETMYDGGNGTQSSPYEIATKEQFLEFYNSLNDRVSNDEYAAAEDSNTYTYYKLTSNITFNEDLNNPDIVFDTEKTFSGYFDGDGHSLNNMVVERNVSEVSNIYYFGGIFGVNRGVVKSVNIGNTRITDASDKSKGSITGIAPLVGINIGMVSTCNVTGSVTFENLIDTTFMKTAGIVASNKGGTVEHCTVEEGAEITAKNGDAVGIVSRASSGVIDSCNNSGVLTAMKGDVIGVVYAESTTIVKGCKNLETGKVLTEYGAAYGVCDGNANITDCENRGIVKGMRKSYGIGNGKTATNCINGGQISNYDKDNYELYGIGYFSEKIESCTNNADITAGFDDVNNDIYGIGYSHIMVNCTNEGALTGGCVQGIGDGYYGMEGCLNKGEIRGHAVYGMGHSNGGEIKECGNTANIYIVNGENTGAYGIGHSGVGYVGCYNTGNIEAIGNNCSAYGIGSLLSIGYAKNCYNTGSITASTSASGLICSVGYANSSDDKYEYVISGCYNTGNITATMRASGIVLECKGFGAIRRCFNTGTIVGNAGNYPEAVGGIVAEISCYERLTQIENCYNAGTIKSSNKGGTGGIVGTVNPQDYTDGGYSFKMLDCYNVGAVSGAGTKQIDYDKSGGSHFNSEEKLYGGALIGILRFGDNNEKYSAIVKNNYYRNDLSVPVGAVVRYFNVEVADYASEILSGYKSASASDMQNQTTYTDWDFEDVWEMGTDEYKYPMLREEGGNTEEGQSGNVFWKIENGKLIISGTGNWVLDAQGRAPWGAQSKYINEVQVISLTESTSLKHMFYGLYNATKIDLSGLDTSRVTDMSGMFQDCSKLTSVDVSGFNTSNVKYMSDMFHGCRVIEELNLSSFDLGLVENTENMFNDCLRVKKITFSDKPASKMKNIESMFFRCYEIKELDLSNWDFSNVTNGYAAFSECNILKSIRTPKNVKKDISINSGNTTLSDKDGNYYTVLPKNKAESMLLLSGASYNASYNGGARTGKVKIEYSDFYLSKPSYTYNHNLARFAAKMAMMCYSSDSKMQAAIDNLGYDGYEYYKYGTLIKQKKENSAQTYSISDDAKEEAKEKYKGESSPYWIAHKTVYSESGSSTLVSVFIRGTSGEEWINNFKPGRGETHAGFDSAASQARSDLSSYIERNNIATENIKYFITGHSRGAATANLLGAKLVNEEKAVAKNADNIYVYTFATPNVTKKDGVDAEGGSYSNIYNIVNPEDFVTKVLPALWGYSSSKTYGRYRRYGKTLVLPSATTDTKETKNYVNYNNYLKKVKEEFSKYAPGEEYEPYEDGMIAVSDYVDGVYQEIKNIDDYYDKKLSYVNPHTRMSDLYINTLGNIMAGHMAKGVLCYLDAAITYDYGHMGVITAGFFFNHEAMSMIANKISAAITGTEGKQVMDEDFANAHRPETYTAAMEVLTEAQLKQNRKTLYGITNCPVDVAVYDSYGNIVGQIVDNEIVMENTEIGMDVNGDSKRFFIPADEDYKVEITGNDKGTLDYSLLEVDPDTGETGRVFYHNLDVSTDSSDAGSKYVQDITAGTAIEDMPVVRNAKNEAEVAVVLGEEELGKLSVNVTVDGEGEAASLSNLSPGDYATVHAYETENSIFKGWYNSTGTELLSADSEYGFSIAENASLVAKFENVPEGLRVEFDKNNSYEFTGKAVVPEFKVYDKKTELKKGTDYTVKLKNNIKSYAKTEEDEGFDYSKAPTVIVSGKGNYSGTINRTFTITPINLSDNDNITCHDVTVETDAKGKAVKPEIAVTCRINGSDVALKAGKDITYIYPDTGENAYTTPGTYNVKINAIEGSNYIGSIDAHVTIIPASGDIKLLSKQKVTVGDATFIEPYILGSKAVPEAEKIVVVDSSRPAGNQVLKGLYCESKAAAVAAVSDSAIAGNGYHYAYYCEHNEAVGTAKITFVGLELNGYKGIFAKSYKVLGKSLKGILTDGINSSYVYSGYTIEPAGSVNSDVIPEGFRVYKKVKNMPDEVLTKNLNYSVEYTNNINTGNATLVIKGINNYTGTVKKTFKITPKVLPGEVSQITVSAIPEQTYVKGGVKPYIIVKDATSGIRLEEGKDYTLSYKNNKKLHSGLTEEDVRSNPAPRIIIKGKGNYSGQVEKIFGIKASSLSGGFLTMKATDIVASNKANMCKPTVTIYDSDGTKLKPKADYNATIKYFYEESGEQVNINDVIPAGTVIRAVAYGLDTGFYSEKVDDLNQISTTFRFVGKNIAAASVAISAQTYTGKAIELSESDITVMMKGVINPLKQGLDYEITGYSNNTGKGNATVTIRGIGNYGGEKIVKFKINQKTMSYTISFVCDLETIKEKIADSNLQLTGKDKTVTIATGTKLPKCGYKLVGTNGKIYTFDGWCTEKNPADRNDGKWYNDQETFRLKSVLQLFGRKETLYAQWK